MNTVVIQARSAVFMDPGLRRDDERRPERVFVCPQTNFDYERKTMNFLLFFAVLRS
jgi:hypothetical protein